MRTNLWTKIWGRLQRMYRSFIGPVLYAFYEKKHLKTAEHAERTPLFIVGAPRTGSTILYQMITNAFEVSYIDNLSAQWYKNILYGFKKSHQRFGKQPHNCFKSDLGRTYHYNVHAPSECGPYWYRFVSRETNYITPGSVSKEKIARLQQEFGALQSIYGQPMVIKNLFMGQRLHLIKEAFPNAKILYIKRDTAENALSILKAKRKAGIADNQYWSVPTKAYDSIRKMEAHDQIIAQIQSINATIEQDLALFDKADVVEIEYATLLQQGKNALGFIQEWYPEIKRRDNAMEPEINSRPHNAQDLQEIEKFKASLKNLTYEQ